MRKSRHAENIDLIIALNIFKSQNRVEIIEFRRRNSVLQLLLIPDCVSFLKPTQMLMLTP